jgi:hypothetical protein
MRLFSDTIKQGRPAEQCRIDDFPATRGIAVDLVFGRIEVR